MTPQGNSWPHAPRHWQPRDQPESRNRFRIFRIFRIVPGAAITAKSQATGVTRATISNAAGEYAITLLPPGTYEIRVDMHGFASVIQPDVQVNVGGTARLNFQLKVASLAETVTVSEAAPLIEVTRSDVGAVVTPKEVRDLPLLTRSFASLTYILSEARPAV